MSLPLQSTPMDPSLVEFITGYKSIHIAAVSEQQQATLVRGLGCRVNADRTRVTVLLARSSSDQVLRAITANHKVAVVFNQPENHKTIQLKGVDAVVGEATDQDRESLGPYLQHFSERLQIFQVPEIYVYTLCGCDPADLVTISFSPLTAFLQTPGSAAGDRLPLGGLLS